MLLLPQYPSAPELNELQGPFLLWIFIFLLASLSASLPGKRELKHPHISNPRGILFHISKELKVTGEGRGNLGTGTVGLGPSRRLRTAGWEPGSGL